MKRFDNDKNMLESSNNKNENIKEIIAGKNLPLDPATKILKTQSTETMIDYEQLPFNNVDALSGLLTSLAVQETDHETTVPVPPISDSSLVAKPDGDDPFHVELDIPETIRELLNSQDESTNEPLFRFEKYPRMQQGITGKCCLRTGFT